MLGNPTAANALVVFTDYECEYCRSYNSVIQAAVDTASNLKVIFRTVPLQVLSARAMPAAVIAHCAADQGQFEAAHRLLADSSDLAHRLPRAELGRRLRVSDSQLFMTCLESATSRAAIAEDIRVARELSITKLPTVLFFNRRFRSPPSAEGIVRGLAVVASADSTK